MTSDLGQNIIVKVKFNFFSPMSYVLLSHVEVIIKFT